jgi:hypothetical protein
MNRRLPETSREIPFTPAKTETVPVREGRGTRPMKVQLTPGEFIRLLHAARELDRQFPWLGQATWLLNCWTDFADDEDVELNLP